MPPSAEPLRVTLLDSIPGWGGGEKWCLQTALALRERDHHVTLACPQGSALARRGAGAGLSLWTARRMGLGPAWPATVLSLARHLRGERIQVVVANVGRDLRLGAAAGALARAALVQRRGLLRPAKGHVLSRWLYGRRVRRVIVNAAAIREGMLAGARFLDPSRFVVIPNGIDTRTPPGGDGTAARRALGVAPDARVALSVARLAPMKGHDDLLRAWARARGSAREAELWLAGEGAERAPLEALAGRLGIREGVRFLGFVEKPDDLYAAADVFVLASRRDEGCSNALLEALWHGCPAVVTACGGLAEMVRPGETGRVVPPGESDALAEALLELLGAPELRRRMGEAARVWVREHASLDRVTERLEAVLREVRDEARAGG